MTLTRRSALGLLTIIMAVAGFLYVQDYVTEASGMSAPSYKTNAASGRYVVLQMHWREHGLLNNIAWNLGTARENSGTFAASTLNDPWRRTAFAQPGSQITFGWAFVDPRGPAYFRWELWIANEGKMQLVGWGPKPGQKVNAGSKGPITVP